MFSSEYINLLLKNIVKDMDLTGNSQKDKLHGNNDGNEDPQKKKENSINITTSQALVILGLLAGVLEPISILIDRNQTVQIILSGSLKEETQLEKIMDQVRKMPFDEVMRALLRQ